MSKGIERLFAGNGAFSQRIVVLKFDFMSRNNIEKGQFTLHPGGVPHGPHPGAIERSIGRNETGELAVMIDPFNPLKITADALNYEVKDYYKSWIIS